MAEDPFASIEEPAAAPAGSDPFAAIEEPAGQAATTAQAAEPKTPGFFKRLAQSIGAPTSKEEAKAAITPVKVGNTPVAAAGSGLAMVKNYSENLYQKGKEFVQNPSIGTGARAAMAVTPMGGLQQSFAEDVANKNYAGAAGTATGVVGQVVVPEVAGKAWEAISPGIRSTARKVTGVEAAVKEAVGAAAEKQTATLAKNKEDRVATVKGNLNTQRQALSDIEREKLLAKDKAAQDTQVAQQQHTVESKRIAEENKAGEQTLGLRQQAETDLQQKTQSYFAKEDAVKTRVKAANDAKWDAWRQKIGDAQVDMQPVRDTIARVQANFPEVKQILKETAPSEEGVSAGNQQYLADRQGFMKQYGYGQDYDALDPSRQGQVDTMMDRMGLKPEAEGVAIDSPTPMSAQQLHDLKTQIGWKVYRNEYPPNVTGAMKQVLRSLEQAEARTSIEHGAIDELSAARQSHADFQEAFGRPRPNRPTGGDIRKKEANPEAFSEQQENARLAAASKHDPTLANDFNAITALREHIKSLPTEQSLRKGVQQIPPAPAPVQPKLKEAYKLPAGKQVPPIPENPTVDINKVAQETIANKAKNWGSFNARDVGILASGYLGGFLEHLFGKGGEVLPIAVTAYEGGKYAASRMLNRPGVVDWLSRTPKSEIDVLRRIPGADRVKVMDGLTQVATDSARNGKPVSLSPDVRTFLGPTRVARIMAASGVTAGVPVNNRKDALELLGQPTQ